MMGDGSATITSPDALRQRLQAIAADIQVDPTANQIRYTSEQVTLVMVGVPPSAPDMSWQVDGRTNPTVVIPAGATVSVVFANGDADSSHGWELTTGAPPYAVMPMMSAPIAASGAVVMPVSHAQGDRWYGATVTFSAPPPGTYYYLCPVPGHAEEGMWGRLIVQ
jgi:rusticyanin